MDRYSIEPVQIGESMEYTQNKQLYEIDDFAKQCHLWSIVPGGTGKGILLLRKIVDAIQSNSYARPDSKLPSILITGSGKQLAANALVNSLATEDIRICHSKYLENGITSYQFFNDSTANTAQIITNIENLKTNAESTLWRYVKNRCCNYYNYATQKYDNTVHCNGLIILTATSRKLVPYPLLKATDHIIELEPLTNEQCEIVVHQYLKFCGIDYDGDQVLQAVVGDALCSMRQVMQLLRTSIVILRGEHEDYLTVEIVEKAKRLCTIDGELSRIPCSS